MLCPFLQASPLGGSTLMTSAPKSDKITAALGPAMKLASSTTFNPEKILSLICFPSIHVSGCACFFLLSPPKLRRSLFKEGRSPFLLVLGSGAQPEERSLQRQALVQAGFQSFGHGFERIPDGDRCVGKDLLQDGFGAGNQIGSGNDFVDQTDAIRFLGTDDFAGKDELQGPAFANQTRQPLCSAGARRDSKFHFGLSEFGRLRGDPNCASHSRFTTAAEREPVAAGFLALDRRQVSKFADVCSRDECLVAGSGQNHAAYLAIVACLLKCGPQVVPRFPVQRIEDLGAIERHVRDGTLLLMQNILKCWY